MLLLRKAARVMLRANLDVTNGLVNGSLGIVHDIVYEEGKIPPRDVPFCILVQFDSFLGPSCVEDAPRVVPIFLRRANFVVGAQDCVRVQFPLSLAWGVTVHK